MGWTTALEAKDYVENLGHMIRIVEGRAELIPHDERTGQQTMEFSKGHAPRFIIDVDLVIEGGCACFSVARPSLQFPLGKEDPTREKSWLHEIMESQKPKSVIFLPGCCGQYDERHQAIIREAFPGIEMHFPEIVHNYCDNVHAHLDRFSNELIKANVLGGE